MYDIIIIGAGPAGLTAAIYALRANKSVLILEKSSFGGQMTFSPKIENYPGFVSVSGTELADSLVEQALAQGAEVELEEVESITLNPDGTKTVKTDSGEHCSKAVIIATGAKHRLLGVKGETDLIGNGISFAQYVTAHSTQAKALRLSAAAIPHCRKQFCFPTSARALRLYKISIISPASNALPSS